jgi:hypothetical protein
MGLLIGNAMGDTTMNVPVEVRTHELQQVKTMMADVAADLGQAELDDAASEVNRIYETHVEGIEPTYPEGDEFAAYLSMPAEDWRMTVRYLNRAWSEHGKFRTHWLQSKLVSRVEGRLNELERDE